jgi:hypothetical protein
MMYMPISAVLEHMEMEFIITPSDMNTEGSVIILYNVRMFDFQSARANYWHVAKTNFLKSYDNMVTRFSEYTSL